MNMKIHAIQIRAPTAKYVNYQLARTKMTLIMFVVIMVVKPIHVKMMVFARLIQIQSWYVHANRVLLAHFVKHPSINANLIRVKTDFVYQIQKDFFVCAIVCCFCCNNNVN